MGHNHSAWSSFDRCDQPQLPVNRIPLNLVLELSGSLECPVQILFIHFVMRINSAVLNKIFVFALFYSVQED